jgi:ABC-type dipeptide/oligopeptide/nickel transport system permease subunit
MQRLWQSRTAVVGSAIVVFILLFAMIAPFVTGHDPNASDFAHGISPGKLPVGPNATYWLGTDRLFRDELARLAAGARLSLFIGFSATIVATIIGAVVGIVSGWYEGRAVDTILMRIVDVGLAFPFLLLVMAIGAALDKTTPTTIFLTLGLTGWLGTARIIRAKTMQIRALDFVAAARALGQSTPGILLRHVLPNVAGPLVIVTTVSVAQMILAESVLSYLGGGVAPPTATWGYMLFEGQEYVTTAPWIAGGPGVAILLCVLGFNLLGEGLRDALDPKRA